MLKNQKFEFYRGDTYQRDFTLSGWSFSIDKVYFTVKEKVENKIAVLQKTLNEGITLVDDEDGVKTFSLMICCNDTENMKVNYEYPFDIEIHSLMDNGDVYKKTIVTGVIKLEASSTRACNEC